MSYRQQIVKQIFKINDIPIINGSIIESSGANLDGLAFATMRVASFSDRDILAEKKVEISTNAISCQFSIQEFENSGKILVSIYKKHSVSATLDGGLTDTQTTINITIASGTIPAKGWILIDSECFSFVRVTTTQIECIRALFQTKAFAHDTGTAVSFAESTETLRPDTSIVIEKDFLT